jgi:hypothetical protein
LTDAAARQRVKKKRTIDEETPQKNEKKSYEEGVKILGFQWWFLDIQFQVFKFLFCMTDSLHFQHPPGAR